VIGEKMRGHRFITQIEIKRFFRYCLLRQYLLNLSDSGVYLYSLSGLKELCHSIGINETTFRKSDLPFFEKTGLLYRSGAYMTLKRLSRRNRTLYNYFIRFEAEIRSAKNPACYFADVNKKRLIWKNVQTQVKMISKKTLDPKSGIKLMQSVRRNNARLGDRLDENSTGDRFGLFLSLRGIGKTLNRCKTTAWKYIERMKETELLKVEKDKRPKKMLTKQGFIFFRRSQNIYVFNW
jgi:hypothetical protein